MGKRPAIMEGLWRSLQARQPFLAFFDLSHSANKAAATAHAPKNIAITSMSIQKLASQRLPLLDFSHAMKNIQNTMQIENNIIKAISS